MESATVLAAHYAKACGRDVVLQEDMRFGMMYAARYVTGRQIGSLFPEIYESSGSGEEDEEGEDGDDEGDESQSDSDGSDGWETVDDEELVWTRYEGSEDDQAVKMNECADSWDAWEPQNPSERALKNAIDKQRES
jgi:hypothetical protein